MSVFVSVQRNISAKDVPCAVFSTVVYMTVLLLQGHTQENSINWQLHIMCTCRHPEMFALRISQAL